MTRRSLPRGRRGLSWAATLTVAGLVCSACASGADPSASAAAPSEPTTPSLDGEPMGRELALATFDSAWSRINSSYYDPDFRGLDWAGIRDELRPAAAEVETRGELRAVLRDMLSRLGESHFAILPEESVDQIDVGDTDDGEEADGGPGDAGLELRWVDGEMTVFRVQAGGAAAAAGVQPGWVVEAVGDRELDRWREVIAEAETPTARKGLEVETLVGARSLLQGSVGTEVALRVRDGAGEPRTVTLRRTPVQGEFVKFGQLPAMAAHLSFERVDTDGGCVGVIAFNVWMVPLVAEFNRAVDAAADCAGVVVDLRGNTGGVGGMVMSTAGSFFAERADLGVIQSRAGEIRFVAMPRGVDTEGRLRDPFEGRLALLIDEMSMSTSELFAAGLKATGRARLFGTQTPGYALPAMTIRLPSQDVLYHVISNLTDPDGQRIEGRGVAPDEALPLRREELLAGRDAAREAAVLWASSGN